MSDIIEVDVDGVQLYPVEVINDAEIEMTVTEQIVEGGSANLQTKSVSFTPTESAQSSDVTPDVGYDGMSKVTVGVAAIPDDYVGTAVPRRASSSLTASGATVTAPAGYYSNQASKSVQSGTAGTPTASKGAVSNHSVSVTPSVTNTEGYISGGTKTGTAVSVSASELVSGSKSISSNGSGIDVANYATANVSVPNTYTAGDEGKVVNNGALTSQSSQTFTANGTYDTTLKNEVVVNVSNAPTLQTKSVSYTPTESAQTASVTPDVGYDGLSSVGVSVAAISSSYVGSGVARKSSSDLTASGATVNVPAGYYESAASKSIASGSATTPATTVTANPTISVNSSTGVITASASATKSVTPTVSAGYVSSGTAGTITVSGSNTSSLSVQSGTTINPTESEQTAVAAGKYTTGAVKVGAISSTYVGSGITSRSSTDLSVSGDTVTAPAGYYAASASKAVASGTAGTPTATKGAVSNHAISVTPSVTNTTGYITGSTKTGTAVSVSASELVSGSETKTQNGTYDVTNLAELVVNVSGGGGGTPAIVVTTETLPNGADHVIVTGADISDTTAVAADVASGKYFYTAAGIKTEGTASGGGGGLDFDVKTVNVTSNTPTVTRAFNNFIFIAQVAEDELPETLSNNVSYFIMFAYVNGAFVNKSGDRGWGVRTNGSSYPFHGGSANFNSTSIGDTSITFSAYTSWVMYQANWKVLQIELPSSADYPLYSFSTH